MLFVLGLLLFVCNQGYAGMIKYERSDQVASIEPQAKTHWGEWGKAEYCYDGSYAAGFKMNVELGVKDVTGVNALVLFCKKKTTFENDNKIVSKYKNWGKWDKAPVQCPKPYFLKGVAIRSQARQLFGDDTAANNFRFKCQDNTKLTGNGGPKGKWSDEVTCPPNSAICGIKTRVEDYSKRLWADNTALNEAVFYCCSI